jgi:hypothetical protein
MRETERIASRLQLRHLPFTPLAYLSAIPRFATTCVSGSALRNMREPFCLTSLVTHPNDEAPNVNLGRGTALV